MKALFNPNAVKKVSKGDDDRKPAKVVLEVTLSQLKCCTSNHLGCVESGGVLTVDCWIDQPMRSSVAHVHNLPHTLHTVSRQNMLDTLFPMHL